MKSLLVGRLYNVGAWGPTVRLLHHHYQENTLCIEAASRQGEKFLKFHHMHFQAIFNNLLFNLYLSEKNFPDRPDFLHTYVFWVVIVPYEKNFLIRDRDRGLPGVRKFRKNANFDT